jgi:hypothetical protein
MNQDEMMIEYMLQMGALQPQQVEMMRKQKQIDALRGASMESPQGQMIGKHYVPPSFMQYASQLGQGYMAGQAQKGQDVKFGELNAAKTKKLEEMLADLRRRRGGMTPGAYGMPDTGTGESSVY